MAKKPIQFDLFGAFSNASQVSGNDIDTATRQRAFKSNLENFQNRLTSFQGRDNFGPKRDPLRQILDSQMREKESLFKAALNQPAVSSNVSSSFGSRFFADSPSVLASVGTPRPVTFDPTVDTDRSEVFNRYKARKKEVEDFAKAKQNFNPQAAARSASRNWEQIKSNATAFKTDQENMFVQARDHYFNQEPGTPGLARSEGFVRPNPQMSLPLENFTGTKINPRITQAIGQTDAQKQARRIKEAKFRAGEVKNILSNSAVTTSDLRKSASGIDMMSTKFTNAVNDYKIWKANQYVTGGVGRGGPIATLHRMLYRDKEGPMKSHFMRKNSNGFLQGPQWGDRIAGAALQGGEEGERTLKHARNAYRSLLRGGDWANFGSPNRLVKDVGISVGKRAWAGAKMANSASKAVLGSSLLAIGGAGALMAGTAAVGLGAMGVSERQVMDTAMQAHETMKQMSKPVYGSSEIGASTQGLVMGLHNRRKR